MSGINFINENEYSRPLRFAKQETKQLKTKIMTPKEKANQLVGTFIDYVPDVENYKEIQKNCALICVSEILNDTLNPLVFEAESDFFKYWEQVEYEINLL